MSPQRLLILGILLYIAWRLVRNLIRDRIATEAGKQQQQQAADSRVQDVLIEDPVCHTLVPKGQAIRLRKDGRTYYFCSDKCCDTFTGKPGGDT